MSFVGRRRTSLARLATVFMAVLGATTGAELALRAAGYQRPTFYRIDQELGWTLRPHAEGVWDSEGYSVFRTNAIGLNNREISTSKPPGTIRVAVLGDSYTEARQIPRDENFCSVLEGLLNESQLFRPSKVEVLNFGVPGYSTAQEFMLLNRVWAYEPDLVVLAMYTDNDIGENLPASFTPRDLTTLRPFFVLQGSHLVPDVSFRRYQSRRLGWLLWASQHVRVFQLVNEVRRRYDGVVQQHFYKMFHRTRSASAGLTSCDPPPPYMSPLMYRPPDRVGRWQAAWKVTDALLTAMRDAVDEHHSRLLVVTLSNAIQVHPDPTFRATYAALCGVSNLFYPDDHIAQYANDHGIAVVKLAPELQTYASDHHVFLHGFSNSPAPGVGHWNREAHRIAAQLMAPRVAELLGGGRPFQ